MPLDHLVAAEELIIRIGTFAGVFAVVALWELVAPRRALSVPKMLRWRANLALVALNTAVVRLVFPLAATGVAAFAAAKDWGLLNHFAVPFGLALALAVVAMDLAIWLQHVMVHAVPALWRLHRVHHADLDYDVTTGTRFHPLEIVLSMLVKCAVVSVLGPPVVAVLIFELLLNASAMFNHGNIRLPAALDRALRWLVVTPDMHRLHHSAEGDEMNANFGFALPWWDRLFGTYRDQPRAGHMAMTMGLPGQRDAREVQRLGAMLMLPWRGDVGEHASIGQGAWPARRPT